jgi:linoleoyl-CoA desaturase
MEQAPIDSQTNFATALTQRVDAYFQTHHLSVHGGWPMMLKSLLLLSVYIGTYTFWITSTQTTAGLFGNAVVLGICHVLLPVNIAHDAIHNAFSRYRWVNALASLSMNVVGGNAYLYGLKHMEAHRNKENGSRRQAIETQQLTIQSASGKLPAPAYLFYAFYMIYIRDFTLVWQAKKQLPGLEWLLFGGFKAAYFVAFWVLPFLYIPLPAWEIALALWSMYLVVTVLLVLILLMPTEALETSRTAAAADLNNAWFAEVLKHNVDFSPDSDWLTFLVGGSNLNVVHYLFPQISHRHYGALARIIRQTANAYQLPYRQERIGRVFSIHFRYLMSIEQA